MTFADKIENFGYQQGELHVRLSNQLVHLLSEQMYSSPVKAMEELVVNAYDADASTCRIGFVTDEKAATNAIVIFDDGLGMDHSGFEQLWHVGQSPKIAADISPRRRRSVIGKFGIGKLATYAIANKITYISRHQNGTFYVSCDFSKFQSTPEGGASEPVSLPVRQITDLSVLRSSEELKSLCNALKMELNDLIGKGIESWTICVLEALKPKAHELKRGRLKWVIKTAMPLKADFEVFIDGEKIERTKEAFDPIVEFSLADIEKSRLKSLNKDLPTKYKWRVQNKTLISELLPNGVSGDVVVTQKSLVRGKSVELGRSHGFFVYVRDRLVNQEDELFGLHALSHATFNFFRADVLANDLHSDITAPREGIEHGDRKQVVSDLLLALFNDARQRQEAHYQEIADKEKHRKEHERVFVSPRLVDQPIADTLAIVTGEEAGTDADEGWFFLRDVAQANRNSLVEILYSGGTRRYNFIYDRLGKAERLVKLDPQKFEFTLNEDHEVILAYSDDPRSKQLLEDVVASEVLLEVYLREAGVNPSVIGEVLERRDLLMRSLARDRVYSLESIAQSLLDARDDKFDLEIAVVAASRALGFNAKHIGGPHQPDGLARFNDYKDGEIKITLEAKSSKCLPELSGLDFAGIEEHKRQHQVDGCLLVAPGYPGEGKRKVSNTNTNDTSVENRSVAGKISCWTIQNLADMVRATETHQITATQILDIILNRFTPKDVSAGIDELLNGDSMRDYYREILQALRELAPPGRLEKTVRTVQHISAILSVKNKLDGVTDAKVRRALVKMSNTSKGIVRLSRNHIIFSGDIEEFARRIANLTGESGSPRKLGSFRKDNGSQ